MSKTILNDLYVPDYIRLYEATNVSKKKNVLNTYECSYMKFEDENENGRFYPREIGTKRILSKQVVDKLKNGKGLLGEINHPDERFSIDMDYVSICTTDLWYEESKNELWGRFDVLDTPRGRIVNTLLEYGYPVGISARAMGSSKNTRRGKEIDVDSYMFKTFDTVVDPGFATSRVDVNEHLTESLVSLCESFTEEESIKVKPLLETLNLTSKSIYNSEPDSGSSEDSWDDSLVTDLYLETLAKLDGANALVKTLCESIEEKESIITNLNNKIVTQHESIGELETLREDNNLIISSLERKVSNLTGSNIVLTKKVDELLESLNSTESYINELETLMEDNKIKNTSLLTKLNEAYESIDSINKPKESNINFEIISVVNESRNDAPIIDADTDRILKRLNKNNL